jgi:ATP-dependent Lhr-like helicase
MEESGRIRRGYFVAGLGAVQFARPGVDDRLRACRDPGEKLATFVLAATDPANPYGSAIPWPPAEPRPQRVPGAHVILVGGALVGYLARGDQALTTFLPEEEPDHAAASAALVAALSREIDLGERDLLVLTSIDAQDATSSALLPRFLEAGFVKSGKGLLRRREGSFARAGRRRG